MLYLLMETINMTKTDAIVPGKEFIRLVVLHEVEPRLVGGSKKRQFMCRCKCGVEKAFLANNLVSGTSGSCGCLLRESLLAANTTHGHSAGGQWSPEYRAWHHIHQRCHNPKDKRYHEWGGRGVTVCRRWKTFANFLADMGPKPSPKHSIERDNNDGNYEPGNCRWATNQEQCNNKSNNRRLAFDGRTQSMMKWSMELGISYSTLSSRIRS